MTDSVHANLDDLKRLKRAVDVASQDVNDALKKLQKSLDRADWRDSARRSFEDKLNSAMTSVRQTTTRLSELQPILNKEIQALEQYLRQR